MAKYSTWWNGRASLPPELHTGVFLALVMYYILEGRAVSVTECTWMTEVIEGPQDYRRDEEMGLCRVLCM